MIEYFIKENAQTLNTSWC